ncbi:MAG: calcium-binding protein [Paracoccaceae bacterium]
MPTTLDFSNIAAESDAITDAHFGLNFVSDYEKIGTKGWEQFDNIVSRIDINALRYPGGTTAETLFDYRNPNKTSAINGAGESVKIESLDEYIDFCNREGINPTIILPTKALLTSNMVNSHRAFDTTQAEDLMVFLEQTLAKVDPSLKVSFELGNEYETYMTSTEYGRVASALTQLIGEAHSNLLNNSGDNPTTCEPDIFVQVWGYSVGGGTSYEELASRNQQVLQHFDAPTLADVDGMVSHFYFSEGRNQGTDQAQTFQEIANQVAAIANMQRIWELACGRELITRVSEWNVLFRSRTDLGLQQIDPMMEMFTSFLRNGFDALDFWSAQYHATSLADSSGRLMAAGTLMDLLKPNVVGTEVGTTIRDDDFNAYTFVGSGRFVSVISSTTAAALDLDFSGSLFPTGYRLVDAYSIGVDETTSDGRYRDLIGLAAYGEPDAKIVLSQLPISIVTGALGQFSLDSFESLILVFVSDTPGRPFVFGTDNADWLYGSGSPTVYVGGRGNDLITYVGSTTAVDLRLGALSTDTGYTGDILISIESVLGSSFNDTITGSGEGDYIDGSLGHDIIFGGDGADTLLGGGGNDIIFGGNGNDRLTGGSGDDIFHPGGGSDTILGEDGADTISFSDFDQAVSIWVGRGKVETERGEITFSGIESFIGTEFGDRFSLGSSNSTVSGLSGNDRFEAVMGGHHRIIAGDGNDSVMVHNSSVEVLGGSGNDTVMSFGGVLKFEGGHGRDWVYSTGSGGVFEGQEGDDTVYALGGVDTFIFSFSSDHDVVYGFRASDDVINFRGNGIEDPWLVRTNSGTQLFFDADNSVLLVGCFLESLAELSYFSV